MINHEQSKSLYTILLVLLYKLLQDQSFLLDQKNDLIRNKLFLIESLPVKDLLKQVLGNFVGKSEKFKQYLKESIDQINEPNFNLNNILECIGSLRSQRNAFKSILHVEF